MLLSKARSPSAPKYQRWTSTGTAARLFRTPPAFATTESRASPPRSGEPRDPLRWQLRLGVGHRVEQVMPSWIRMTLDDCDSLAPSALLNGYRRQGALPTARPGAAPVSRPECRPSSLNSTRQLTTHVRSRRPAERPGIRRTTRDQKRVPPLFTAGLARPLNVENPGLRRTTAPSLPPIDRARNTYMNFYVTARVREEPMSEHQRALTRRAGCSIPSRCVDGVGSR